ncbi:tryptophan 7-halogenase [Roseateles sp.]|uniref:tryptophan halogenase family protein n=1 Tax=Roseateles sp. TaxID=1971397 RepID=UPI00286D276B|nr:tryptophan 7-halogenase [Roseateles sp.]
MKEPIEQVKRIVILGGGSAGWLSAALIAAEHKEGLQVTLLESPDVPAIGVGEGTWPTMRDTLRKIGISETELVRQCEATFKQGSKFIGWVTGQADDCYDHPFVLPQGYTEANLVAPWLERHRETPFAELLSFQPHLCARGLAPKQAATPEYAAVANYGYHFDAVKFGHFLRRHCIDKLGVKHVQDHMVGINSAANGDIASLQTKAHGALAGELFIDCSGMPSLLLGQHFGVEWLSQQDVLFNDSALAVQLPYAEPHSPIASQTLSTAQSSGWIWDIGLQTRRGIGYVYSSRHISDPDAELELRAYLAKSGSSDASLLPRKISFKPGYRAQFWHKNCVAIGLSAGFIEPLEASALALVELSAALVSEEMPATRELMEIAARRFNDAFSYRWARVIDFLKLHYVLSRRTDSAYWREQAASTPPRLQELLAQWQQRPPSRHDFHRIEEMFPSASYHYVLYGMGFKPAAPATMRRSEAADNTQAAEGYYREAARLSAKMAAALPSHRDLIEHIKLHGLHRI